MNRLCLMDTPVSSPVVVRVLASHAAILVSIPGPDSAGRDLCDTH